MLQNHQAFIGSKSSDKSLTNKSDPLDSHVKRSRINQRHIVLKRRLLAFMWTDSSPSIFPCRTLNIGWRSHHRRSCLRLQSNYIILIGIIHTLLPGFKGVLWFPRFLLALDKAGQVHGQKALLHQNSTVMSGFHMIPIQKPGSSLFKQWLQWEGGMGIFRLV